MRSIVTSLLALLALGATPGAVAAQASAVDPLASSLPWLSEVRLGVTTAAVELNEAVLILPAEVNLGRVSNITGEALFEGFDLSAVNVPGEIRPVLGASLNVLGGDSWAWAGLNYHVALLEPVFFEFTLGGTVHNGYLDNPPPGRDAYGCRALIYASGGFGVNLSDTMTVSLTLDHGSHAKMCGATNPGFNALSLKLGYKF